MLVAPQRRARFERRRSSTLLFGSGVRNDEAVFRRGGAGVERAVALQIKCKRRGGIEVAEHDEVS